MQLKLSCSIVQQKRLRQAREAGIALPEQIQCLVAAILDLPPNHYTEENVYRELRRTIAMMNQLPPPTK